MIKRAYLVDEASMADMARQQALPSMAAPIPVVDQSQGFGYEVRGGLLNKLKALEAEIHRLTVSPFIADDQKLGLISNLQTKLQNFQNQFRGSVASATLPVVTPTVAPSPHPVPPAIPPAPPIPPADDDDTFTGAIGRKSRALKPAKRRVADDDDDSRLEAPGIIGRWLKLSTPRSSSAADAALSPSPIAAGGADAPAASVTGAVGRKARAPKTKHKRERVAFDLSTALEPSPRRLRTWTKLRNTRDE